VVYLPFLITSLKKVGACRTGPPKHQGPFVREQLLNFSQMTQVDFKVFKESSQPGCGLCASGGNEA